MQYVVKASHVLVTLDPNSTPADTLKAFNQIQEIREKALAGEDFNELASEFSQDPSAAQNKGNLGYFSAFRMIYPFEKAAFATEVGAVSNIIRTDFGYHIIKVHEKLPNLGKIRVAHIMKMFDKPGENTDDLATKMSIDSIYREWQNGEPFEKMAARYSDDKNSSGQGGEMRAFTLPEMVPEFALAAFELQEDGAVSEPVKTDYGWHIIKRLELEPVKSYEDEYAHISNMMSRDGRSNIGTEAFIKSKMKGSDYRLNEDALAVLYQVAEESRDNAAFFDAVAPTDEALISYYKDVLTVSDFMEQLKSDEAFNIKGGEVAIDNQIEEMAFDLVMEVENRDLALHNEKYKYLINEYFDGLLIFEISNNEIWQNVGKDTLALQGYYENHLSEFTPAPVLKGVVCEVVDKRLNKRMLKRFDRTGNGDNLVQILKDNARNDQQYNCEEGMFEFALDAGNPVDKSLLPEESVFKHYKGSIYWEGEVVESEPLPYDEVVGQVMSSFQQWKEEQWVRDLREKHQPVFEYELLK
ncbi:peptidylprolyl isomerase [Geofilum rubicundum]|uniref:peptidylprolyl isomerase n=1 Tax=Geofilum rubicundum JCM 15548 TaxID=1236989 RepID=A0A0E9M2P9_9BACT|nr:peptidylprolyl isomerase [Geofilum rubicundum]GAO31848.1 foldase protein PrsA precursor [Geofilum rubicundum JCM 15548]